MNKLVILISLLLLTTFIRPQAQTSQSFALTKTPKTIALIHHEYLYFVKLRLNNREANFLIDTGAAASLLDINQANVYNFKFYLTENTFAGAGGLSHRFRVTEYSFIHDNTKLNVYPYGADLKFVVESFSDKGISVVGVIGSDFLTRHDAIIDYKNEKLILHH